MNPFLIVQFRKIFFLGWVLFCISTTKAQGTDSLALSIKAKLKVPFGTIEKMHVEIVDGDELRMKGYAGMFLFRVLRVGNKKLAAPVIIEFKDETGKFPNEMFGLYKYLYGKTTGALSLKEEETMKKKYVGKMFEIIGYETGSFVGVPDGYFKYQEIRQNIGFGFKNYIIVIALANEK